MSRFLVIITSSVQIRMFKFCSIALDCCEFLNFCNRQYDFVSTCGVWSRINALKSSYAHWWRTPFQSSYNIHLEYAWFYGGGWNFLVEVFRAVALLHCIFRFSFTCAEVQKIFEILCYTVIFCEKITCNANYSAFHCFIFGK